MSNPQEQVFIDKHARQINKIDKLVLGIKREYGSLRTFSPPQQMPIVTYTASVDGTKPLEACTDLSLLSASDLSKFQKVLSDHHSSQFLKLLTELSHVINDLYSSVEQHTKGDHFSDHPDYGDLEEFEHES